jgi:hypothetical protein
MKQVEQVLAELARHGLLLKQDKVAPSVVGILTGESLNTSWWSHPEARLIFAVLSELADHPDVLVAKLLHRKDTLVHRSLWPALLAVGMARQDWQLRGLSAAARDLLAQLDRGEVVQSSGSAVKELEIQLLATPREVHTESGRHAIVLESWPAWSARVGCEALKSILEAERVLENAAANLGARRKSLPWPVRAPRS